MKAKKTEGTELRDLDVDRIDGVDRPATGRKFLILKGKDALRYAPITKAQPPAPSVREYDIEELNQPKLVEDSTDANAENKRVAESLESMAGRSEDGNRRPVWAKDSFLAPTGMYGLDPMKPYEVVEDPGIASPDSMNFARPSSHGLATPENFGAPKPKSVRMGDGRILKRGPSFADVLFGPEPVKKAGEDTQDVDWSEVHGPSRWHR